ncbi:MAG: cytochrome o ubiquinol oxidase subunit IV [Steroidobacteraceae bacterium]
MSAGTHETADHAAAHGHDAHGDDHGGHGEAGHGTLKSYVVGFILSAILTAIPFWLVMSGVISSKQGTILAITAFAVVQIVVHMVCFLHMTPSAEEGWSLTALIFTIILVVIALIGSIWVMYHLNANMAPGHDMTQPF